MTRLIHAIFIGFIAIVSLPVKAQEANPALWQVEGKGATLYILGTVHLLPPETKWQSDAVLDAIKAAQSLSMEVEDPQAAGPEITQYTVENGVLKGGQTLKGLIGADAFNTVAHVSQNLGVPAQGLNRMRPWLASISLTLAYAQANGFQADSGAEAWLMKAFRQLDKPILGLEEPLIAIRALAEQDAEMQALFLSDTLTQLEDGGEVLHAMHDAWLKGDVDALIPMLIEPMQERPALLKSILYNRNENWLPKLEVLMDAGGTHFIAVGTAHLIGDKSLLVLLKDAGYEVTRLTEPLK